ncbi:protein PLANT CADMIUM RESISTANCE 3-like [Lingula anatina]|uniref:Protein PLANT CADMIUM RESISTANCE 3-like n=1 Tax=Lingula anatina TaxID=7574 RepID=A0A1S3H9K8_LINAN|nr:protein PLANT CADMIUM RESISTANCE 3-like [Lingula anatina]|eukprot:XP_013382687.1 protein PLANT CADMIUM RESISTANCE 3-like [Lingula anatina]
MAEWKQKLFGCFNNFGICIVTYFVPCLTAGKNAEAVGESCGLYGCLSILGPVGIYTRAKIREKIREKQGIEGDFVNDCLMHWFCGLCALVQEAQVGTGVLSLNK